MALDPAASIGAGALVGVVFGAIVGAMAGHQSEDELLVPNGSARLESTHSLRERRPVSDTPDNARARL